LMQQNMIFHNSRIIIRCSLMPIVTHRVSKNISSALNNNTDHYNPNNDAEVQPPPTDGISQLAWSPKAHHLVASSWDKEVRFWDVKPNGTTEPKASISHEQPALCCCWSDDGTKVFSGGCDNKAFCWDLASNTKVQVGQHDNAIKYIHWYSPSKILMTGSWDKTIKYWDARTPNPAAVANLPERLYCADVRDNLAVIATADRKVIIYNLQQPQIPFKQIDSPLRYQSRCVKTFPNKSGFALGSIEGRVAIHHVEQGDASKNFAFKCHRQKNNIYAVNDIAFHPLGTFATCGSDGTFHFWDKDSKQRLKAFKKCNLPVTCCEFSADGNIFAYAVCYDWHQGASYYNPAIMKNHILLHQTGEEIKPKGTKK